MTEAHERFYTLVEKVYLLKLQNGELDQHTYSNVMSAVDDIMAPINQDLPEETVNNIQKSWSVEMKQLFTEVYQDFKQGKLSWTTISLQKVQSIGSVIIENVINGVDEYYKSIRKNVFKEVTADLGAMTKKVNRAEDYLSKVFRSIIGKP